MILKKIWDGFTSRMYGFWLNEDRAVDSLVIDDGTDHTISGDAAIYPALAPLRVVLDATLPGGLHGQHCEDSAYCDVAQQAAATAAETKKGLTLKNNITRLALLLVFSSAALTQTIAVPMPISNTTVNSAALPSITIGAGPSWTRGGTYAASADVDIALHIGTGNWYSWSTVSTPVTTLPVGPTPIASTITTGGAWIAAQSPTGSVSLITIVQAGFSTVQATSTTAPAFTGSIGVAFRLGKKPIWIMPYAKASNTSTGTSGALATAVFQPGVMVLYGFGGK